MSKASDEFEAWSKANAVLRKELSKRFGSFGEEVLALCLLREETGAVTDIELSASFDCLTSVHRKCFNKKAFIASCREPI
jgi:hypothetical protein